jgi:hypothetical protein
VRGIRKPQVAKLIRIHSLAGARIPIPEGCTLNKLGPSKKKARENGFGVGCICPRLITAFLYFSTKSKCSSLP